MIAVYFVMDQIAFYTPLLGISLSEGVGFWFSNIILRRPDWAVQVFSRLRILISGRICLSKILSLKPLWREYVTKLRPYIL